MLFTEEIHQNICSAYTKVEWLLASLQTKPRLYVDITLVYLARDLLFFLQCLQSYQKFIYFTLTMLLKLQIHGLAPQRNESNINLFTYTT